MLNVKSLKKYYYAATGFGSMFSNKKPKIIHAVDGVDFELKQGEVLGLVGESGCGKSTLARTLVGLENVTEGVIELNGSNIVQLQKTNRRHFHKQVQMVFQDPYGSLNPQHKIVDILIRPLIYQRAKLSKKSLHERAVSSLEEAGLKPADQYLDKYPHQLSGGQRQRVCIARAIILEPKLLVADEPISMLDVSIKWGIIQLLKSLVKERNLSMIYVTHDLASVGSVCDKLAIMYLGKIVEYGPVSQIVEKPQHPYTKALLASTPSADPNFKRQKADILGGIPNAMNIPSGCRFHPRCTNAIEKCKTQSPKVKKEGEHITHCHLAFDVNKNSAVAAEVEA